MLTLLTVGISFAGAGKNKDKQQRKVLQEAVMDSIIQGNNFRIEMANNVTYSGYYREPYIDVYPDRIYVKVYENTPADYATYKVIKKEKMGNKWFYNFTYTGSRNQDMLVEMVIDPGTGKVDYKMRDRKHQIGIVSLQQGSLRQH